jgi:hypothetical protein
MNTEMIDHTTLSRLVETGAVRAAHVVGQPGGWGIIVKYGMVERPLAAQRSRQVRLFRRFDTLVTYLKGVGIAKFDVDAVNYDPTVLSERGRSKAVSAGERMKQAHEAAAYDKWFRAKVQEALDDPRPSIPHAEVMAQFEQHRQELRNRIKGQQS